MSNNSSFEWELTNDYLDMAAKSMEVFSLNALNLFNSYSALIDHKKVKCVDPGCDQRTKALEDSFHVMRVELALDGFATIGMFCGLQAMGEAMAEMERQIALGASENREVPDWVITREKRERAADGPTDPFEGIPVPTTDPRMN